MKKTDHSNATALAFSSSFDAQKNLIWKQEDRDPRQQSGYLVLSILNQSLAPNFNDNVPRKNVFAASQTGQ